MRKEAEAMENRLVIISNRLPFKIERKEGKWEVRMSSGGLVSAMDAVIGNYSDVLWVGAADFSESSWKSCCAERTLESKCRILPVFIGKKLEKRYYHGFSNTILWPLFHYFPSYAVYKEEFYAAYCEVNRLFSETVLEELRPGDTVWVHDYHLMLLPALLKNAQPAAGVGFFLHIPFPSYEILKQIPENWRNNILASLLRCDVVGFHTREYVSHFQRSLSFFLGIETEHTRVKFETKSVLIRDYPISIDFDKFNRAFSNKSVARLRSQMRNTYRGKKLIFSVDRLDYTKGVLNRLQAFEEVLNEKPELRQKVVFIINVVPSRDKHKKYAERRRLIEEQISHINGLYGNVQWTPIIYQYSHLTFNQLVAFYTTCDVALVTPLRDGMNLVAKEFVASRADNQGVLVLSEFAGAANELAQALLVNPNDVNLMKDALAKAITLSPEAQAEAMIPMRSTVRQNDIHKWANNFIEDLQSNRNMNMELKIRVMDFDERVTLFDRFRKAANRLILLDYDGTLVPYFDRPEQAAPDRRTLDLLAQLASNPQNRVVVISGRETKTLETWFEAIPVDLVAEHGAYHKPYGSPTWTFADFDSECWKPAVKDVFEKLSAEFEGSFMEEKNHSVTWHYRRAKLGDEEAVVQRACRELLISNPTGQFNVLCGNKVIEAKNVNFDKGKFAVSMADKGGYDLVLAIGDDATDEDMFRRLNGPHCYTLRVGLTGTAAMYNLIGISNVHSFLNQLSYIRPAVDRLSA